MRYKANFSDLFINNEKAVFSSNGCTIQGYIALSVLNQGHL